MLPRRSANKQKIWELNHFSQAVQLNAASTALAFAAVPTGSGVMWVSWAGERSRRD